ncbi:MAG TPA: aldo/keto reductase [Acidobacteriaceae bacterium]|nr:aldo/keto reductase [Acidobacteriaceae bacterium]
MSTNKDGSTKQPLARERTLSSPRHRRLGRTDLQVFPIGFGASPLGDVFGTTDAGEGKRAVHAAIDSGINFFDVAPYYGRTLAEKRLGEALAGRRHQVLVATKCGRYGQTEFDFSARRVTAGVDESLKRLQTDYVDLLQVHDVEFGDAQQIIDETLPALRLLQEQGKARYIGITGYGLKLLVRIAKATPVDTVLSYCRYNLMNRDMDEILTPFASERQLGLINASPLNMGVLTAEGAPAWHPAPPQVLEAGRKAAQLCRSRGADISALALRFCLDHPYVSTTLVGMSTVREVEANLAVMQGKIDSELLAEVEALLAPVFGSTWPSGKEENRD